jgi:hypothetical protein
VPSGRRAGVRRQELPRVRDQAGLADFVLVALGGTLATLACLVRVRAEHRMLRMRDVTDTIRRTVLRLPPPGWGGLDHAGVYLTADTHARVGGDFYGAACRPRAGCRSALGTSRPARPRYGGCGWPPTRRCCW